jgi:hypothetical protein
VYNEGVPMENRKQVRIALKLGSEVFTGLGTAYLIAISASINLLSLTNNVVFCILCLYTAYRFEEQLGERMQ